MRACAECPLLMKLFPDFKNRCSLQKKIQEINGDYHKGFSWGYAEKTAIGNRVLKCLEADTVFVERQ